MKVHNTLTGKKEEFITITPNEVRMYVCGPTVYNLIHIGNARPYVVFDTVRRYLEYCGYKVIYVQNFTDVDDKIIAKANQEGVDSNVIARKYTEEALRDAEGLNVLPSSYNPKVTEEMPQIIEMIARLIENGFAYEKNGAVYFNTPEFSGYGKLSHRNVEELEAGARVEIDAAKNSPTDFVLWKPAKPGEPEWSSPWSSGRPGWHIECSAMAKRYLGDEIDIHAGGEDLIFPHHENEIAQSEAANGVNFARYWLHNGFINVDNQKMSKSKGNFFLLRDIVDSFAYNTVRFFLLSSHYRSPVNFSDELMQAAENGLERIKTAVRNLQHQAETGEDEKISERECGLLDESGKFRESFERCMDDDFNTADAISAIFELVKFTNINIEGASRELARALEQEIIELGDILGLVFEEDGAKTDSAGIERLIEERQAARKAKDWARADALRDELQA
ncbi:MAG: cysteine--tRNA ligase, partial [Defluviitaleaceae bacterium]|nr:cysteine--tRNA ligase [Defluviitaleaceae bacterium]